MSNKLSKKYSASIVGILDISDGKILVEVEDRDKPINLIDWFSDFDGKDVSISINHKLEC